MKTSAIAIRVLIVMLLLISACSSSENDVRQSRLLNWGETIIVPGYRSFLDEAAALKEAAATFCDSPSDASLTEVRSAWNKARSAWKRMEVFAFGPYEAYPDRLGPNIDYWPVRADRVEEELANESDLSAESMPPLGATKRGLPVIEYLIYAEKDASLETFNAQPRRCTYLAAASGDLHNLATQMFQAWDPAQAGYLNQLTRFDAESMYMNSQEAMSEIVNRMAFTIENIRRDKLDKPLGNTETGVAHPESVESFYSGRSIQDIHDALATIGLLFSGDEQTAVQGLASLRQLKDRQDLVTAFHDYYQKASNELTDVTIPLSEAVQDQPGSVQQIVDTLRNLQTLIHADVINVLGLSIAFNDTDGD